MGLPKKRTDDRVGVNILLSPDEHKKLRFIAAMNSDTLRNTIGKLIVDEAARRGVDAL